MKTILEFYRVRIQRIAIFLALAFATVGAKAQIVTFPDSALESAVRNQLQIYSPTPIQESDMLTLKNLGAAFYGIQDLTGLETASNLTSLDLGYNNLTNLAGLSPLTTLTNLHIGGNPFQECGALSVLTNLILLDMNSSQLTNVAGVSTLHKLNTLIVPWNHLTDVSPVFGLTQLAYLDIGGNRSGTYDASITNIDGLASLTNLQWLSLYYLRATNFEPVANLKGLTNLDLSWNYTPTNFAPVSGLTNLRLLHITADSVTNISFMGPLSKLNNVDIGYNNITDLSPLMGKDLSVLQAYGDGPLTNSYLVTNFTDLQNLSLGSEALTNISIVSGLTNLQQLYLDGNSAATDLSPIIGLSNLTLLNINGSGFTNVYLVTNTAGISELDMNTLVTPPDLSFLPELPFLSTVDASYDQVGTVAVFTNTTFLSYLNLSGNYLTDILPLQQATSIYHLDLTYNLLDLSDGSPALFVISNLEYYGKQVNYLQQNLSPYLRILDSPSDVCISPGDMAYFGGVASTTTGNQLLYQWQHNGLSIPGETRQMLVLSDTTTNQAGEYRMVVTDQNGYGATAVAHLYVGDPNCGMTLHIVHQPASAVAGPGEFVEFTVVASITLSNLYFQWQFNGTNISGDNIYGDTSDTLDIYNVDYSAAGTYQVLVWDDSSNVVASIPVQLSVVDEVDFTDPKLADLVNNALGYSPGTTLHLSELDNLSYLFAGGNGVTNLDGLRYARNLYYLDISGSQISDPTPLSWDYQLNYLYMDSCGLQDASFVSPLTNLINLSLSFNSVHSFPDMSGMAASLNYFHIDYNGPLIYDNRLAVLTNLTQLSVHDDGLADINFVSGMDQLYSFDAGTDYTGDQNGNYFTDASPLTGKNQLTSLALNWTGASNVIVISNCAYMNYLGLDGDHLDNIDFLTNMPYLNSLLISYSEVTNLAPITNCPDLNSIEVAYIRTTNLSYISNLTQLYSVTASGNHTGTANFVAPLSNISWLQLDSNDITSFAPIANLTNLYYFNGENNQVSDATPLGHRTNLYYCYLSGNRIHNLSPLVTDTNLQNLSLNANGCANLAPLAGLTSLTWLTLQSNSITDVTPLAGLTNLIYDLDLSSNYISDISPLANLSLITGFPLYHNQITRLPSLAGLTNLSGADFSQNLLTNADGLSGMRVLNYVNLSQNKLTKAPTLTGVPNLNSIDLTSNNIVDVSPLGGLTELNWLYLSHNKIQNIHALTDLTSLYYIDLRYNWLDTNAGSATRADITTMQLHTYVDYDPQYLLFMTSPQLDGGNHMQFSIISPLGDVLNVEKSSDLTHWSFLRTITNATGSDTFTDGSNPGTQQFYRLKK